MKCHETKLRVRYGETEQMGVVYHGNYVQYLEIGRIEWLRNLGVSYKKMEEDGIMLPVISIYLNYKRSACYDDVIYVKTQLNKMPMATIEFDYEILNEDREIITLAKVILAFINMKSKSPTRCPKYILDKLQN